MKHALLLLAALVAVPAVAAEAQPTSESLACTGETRYAESVDAGRGNVAVSSPDAATLGDDRIRDCTAHEKQQCTDGCLLRNPGGGSVLARALTECGIYREPDGKVYRGCTCIWLSGDAKKLVP